MISEPVSIISVCAILCALVFWVASQPWSKGFFGVVPAVIFVYYLPTLAASLEIIPRSSVAYDWMRDYLLPFSLFILMVTSDVRAVVKVGPRAILMMLFGTAGIVIGGPLVYLVFKGWLEPDAWKALASLSGSWIGGGGNFAAIKESVGASDALVGPIIIVDTAVGYTWTGVLLFLVNYQRFFDRLFKADSKVFQDLNSRLEKITLASKRPLRVQDATGTIAVGLFGVAFCTWAGQGIFARVDPLLRRGFPELASVCTEFTWMVILITTLGILLSVTPIRKMEEGGASKIGYAALYLFLASLGARADLGGLLSAPVFLLVGIVWIMFHVAFLFLGARLLKAPLFLAAVGSQANIGGAVTAPIVASAFYQSLAPVGLLLGIAGYLVGNYAGLLCAFLLSLVS